MIAVDSSVVVAACASWHEAHGIAQEALDERPRLIAHCALETFATLTRLPWPHRIQGEMVARFLEDRFVDEPLMLSALKMRDLVSVLHGLGLSGGAIYDGYIALTAAEHGANLVSLDRRAEDTYRRCGASYRILM